MKMTGANQLKARIKNLATQRGVDPRALIRIFMMERFLDRVSQSEYQENFILKGGMLISYLIGVDLRTTMDIDTTMQNTPLSIEATRIFVEKVIAIDADDGVMFSIVSIEEIMDEADYPGLRVSLLAHFDGTSTPVKIDVSTGDRITPSAILTDLQVMFTGPISMLVYPTETVIAEKLPLHGCPSNTRPVKQQRAGRDTTIGGRRRRRQNGKRSTRGHQNSCSDAWGSCAPFTGSSTV